MNSTSQNMRIMHDPYVRGTNDAWAAAPEGTPPRNGAGARGSTGIGMQPQSAADPSRFQHGLSEQVIGNPISVEEAYLGSMQAMLAREIGAHIGAVFIIGTGQMIRSEGQLTEVGNNYIVIYQQDRGRYVVGDLNSLRFVEFFEGNNSKGSNFQGVTGIVNGL